MESMTNDDTDEMVILSQIPILDGEEWSLSEAIDRYKEQKKTNELTRIDAWIIETNSGKKIE